MDDVTGNRRAEQRTDRLVIRRPDDWHVHFRDGEMLRAVAPYTARQFARAIVMPNLMPPVTTAAAARAYRERILDAVPRRRVHAADDCYLTDDDRRRRSRARPRGGRVGRGQALPRPRDDQFRARRHRSSPGSARVLERMQEIGMPLLRARRGDRARASTSSTARRASSRAFWRRWGATSRR